MSKCVNQNLNAEFVSTTLVLRDIMAGTEAKCKDFEKKAKVVTFNKQTVFIDSLISIYRKMDECFRQLWMIAKGLSHKKLDEHKKYFQNKVLSYFVRETTPLNHRIYHKPLGYGGDYIVMNYLYEDGYPGDDTYSKFVDRYTLYLPEARAHIFRRQYFKKLIAETIEMKRNNKDIKIASIASGPAVEMLDVVNDYEVPGNTYFFAIDGEPLALEQIKKKLKTIEEKKRKTFSFNIYHQNVVNMVRRNSELEGLDNLDIAYSAGFFDYLSNRTCSMLINYMYKRLKKGGIFIGVNIFQDHPCRLGMEMVGEWYLNHRDEKCMLSLAKDITDAEYIKIDFDPTKTNIYLIIRK